MRKFLPTQKWLVLAMLVLTACAFMGQRGKRKYPSPADPGMRMENTVQPTIPKTPEIVDPSAGDDPHSEKDLDDEGEHRSENVFRDFPDIPQSPPDFNLNLKRLEIMRVVEGSALGKPGDYALVISGSGFVEGEGLPIVHLGDTVLLTETAVGANGAQLFAILPAEVAAELPRRNIMGLSVQNPGGLNRDPNKWVTFPLIKAAFLQELSEAKKAFFARGAYFMEIRR
jgi:hypothetical protein